MSLGTSCSSTSRNHSGHCSYGYLEGCIMEIAHDYKRSKKQSQNARWPNKVTLSISISHYPDAKTVFFTRNKEINKTLNILHE